MSAAAARGRIAFVTFSRPGGGPVSFLARSCEYLIDEADVTLIDEEPERVARLLTPRAASAVRLIHMPVWSAPRAAIRQLRAEFGERPPNWVVVNNPAILVRYLPLFRSMRAAYGTRVQFTIHSAFLTPTAKRRALEFVTSCVLVLADRVTCVSDFTRRVWQRRYPWTRAKRFHVIHHGVTLPQAHAKQSTRPLRVALVGRLIEEKDPFLFGEVAKLARERGLAIECHAYGEGPLTIALRDRYGAFVTLHGQHVGATAIYPEVDILLMTSPIENCPNALLEAKSWAVPCVAAAVGGIPELIDNGVDGVLAARRDAPSFVDALERVIGDHARFSANCLLTRERFSITRHAALMWRPLLERPEGAT